MTDGIGATNYTYYPVANPPALGATQLQNVDGPFANDTITYGYDELDRVLSQFINGVASSVTYDSLGRLVTSDNVLGHFARGYVNVTTRLQTLTYPVSTGQTANYTYFDNSHDRRLQTLQNVGPSSANISKFDYTYDPEGQILSWTKRFANQAPVPGSLGYDLADQITSATNTALGNLSYSYDLGANRTFDQGGPHIFNNVNQTQDVGYTYDLNGNLTSDGFYNYGWDGLNRLVVIEQIIPGTGGGGSSFAAVKPSPSPGGTPAPMKLKRRRGLASSGTSGTNAAAPLGGGGFPPPNVTYTRSVFTYDGLSRRVRIVEAQDTRQSGETSPPNFVTISDNRYVWSDKTIAEERDSTGAVVTKRFFADGEQIAGINYYFTRDHLGSVRELTNSSGQIVESYDYDPYGNQFTGQVNQPRGLADFGFTGHWFHWPSGFNLSLYRAYDSYLGRWLNRDPLGNAEMRQGPNLYAYVENNPTDVIDPFGLKDYSTAETQALIDQSVIRVTDSWNPFARALALYNLHGTGGNLDTLLKQNADTFCIDGRQLNSDDFGNYLAGYDSQAALSLVGDDIVRAAALFYATANATTGSFDFNQIYLNQGIHDAMLRYGIFGRFGH